MDGPLQSLALCKPLRLKGRYESSGAHACRPFGAEKRWLELIHGLTPVDLSRCHSVAEKPVQKLGPSIYKNYRKYSSCNRFACRISPPEGGMVFLSWLRLLWIARTWMPVRRQEKCQGPSTGILNRRRAGSFFNHGGQRGHRVLANNAVKSAILGTGLVVKVLYAFSCCFLPLEDRIVRSKLSDSTAG